MLYNRQTLELFDVRFSTGTLVTTLQVCICVSLSLYCHLLISVCVCDYIFVVHCM